PLSIHALDVAGNRASPACWRASSSRDYKDSVQRNERDPLLLAGAALVLHLAVANRYDYFRDELYFIICGRHPSFGYVDQPPLVPLLAAGSQLFGQHLWLMRAIPALAHAALVYVG